MSAPRRVGLLLCITALACSPTLKGPTAMGVGAQDRACDAGDAAACHEVALAYERQAAGVDGGLGFDRTPWYRATQAAWERACRAGDREGCDKALRHWGVNLECEHLREIGRIACDRWDDAASANACDVAGQGCPGGAPADAAYLGRACERGQAASVCIAASSAEADPARRLALLEQSCALGGEYQCAEAGHLREAAGAIDDAERLYLAACTEGLDAACDTLLELERARCDADDEPRCVTYATALKPSDPIRAAGVLDASCARGYQEACDTAARWRGGR